MPPTGPRQTPLSLDALLSHVTAEGWLDARDAAEIKAQERRQLAALVKAHRGSEPLTAAVQRELEATFTPIEVLASFSLKARDGRALSEDLLTELVAGRLGLPYVKLDPLKLDAAFVTSVFSKPFARKHGLIPLESTADELTVATYDPFDAVALEDLRRVTQKRVRLVFASKSDIQHLITEFFGFQKSVEHAERDLTETIDLGNLEQFVRLQSEREIEASDQHVVNAVEYLFNYAFQQRASDIHIEPKRERSEVRFRIDGALHRVNTMPLIVHRAVVNRIKTLARLDIGEKRRPQDGRIKTDFRGKPAEFRISTLPVAFGEKVVLRIFDPAIAEVTLAELGFFERDLALFEKLIRQPHGIILVTGPTGSGKTTTLYAALRVLATEDVNISTIEDPIEMVFERVNQTAVQPAVGLGFAESLRTLLRQDPDIIMVGEIRDLETAQNAVQAALTGHLVFSTLHTNDSAGAVTRLMDLGVQHFLIAPTLTGLIAQRLLRRVCSSCAVERLLLPSEARELGIAFDEGATTVVRHGTGCAECRQTGYRGRSAIYEMCEITEPIRELILARASSAQIKRQAQQDGMLTLRQAAVKQLLDGITSFEEVLAVTGQD
jgi:general secretion pathway protein E